MHRLFPKLKPNDTYRLAVEPPHVLYVEESGNPQGLPVLVVHGGPGAGCEDDHRRFFDPSVYRIILFDQRGAGRSIPHACLENNSTQKLVQDMEVIRKHIGIDKWVLFGGSWGSALSLVYAQAHPECVRGLILRGIFLCRPEDIHWLYQNGANRIFPDHWEEFVAPIPQEERGDLVQAHHQRLIGDDEIARMASAKAWAVWEARTSSLLPKQSLVDFFGSPHTALSLARIESHYFVNDSFLEPDQILVHSHRLKNIPGIIVHGRYDMVCPIENAWALNQAWSESLLEIIPDAGHSATEPSIINALIRATIDMAVTLREMGR